MSQRSWRLSQWTNPGASTQSIAKLDDIVNRDLLVKRNALVKGDLTLLGKFNWGMTSYQSYTPNVIGYKVAAGGGALATIHFGSITGRWRRFDTIVFFEAVIPIIAPRSADWASNLYVDLPVKTNFQFSASATWHAPGDTSDSTWYSLFAVARANASQIVIIPTTNSSTTPVLMFSTPPPMEITVSGTYEAAP